MNGDGASLLQQVLQQRQGPVDGQAGAGVCVALLELHANALGGSLHGETGGGRQSVLAAHAVVYEGIGRSHGFNLRRDKDLESPVTNASAGGELPGGPWGLVLWPPPAG